jgi:4-aminobutyrate aminotransferase/(S)-3-amino-2-methylpropionate transaminase
MLRESLLAMQREGDLGGDVRGRGPMVAMELGTDRKTKEPAAAETKALVKYCLDRGVIILACGAYGNIIRFLMPLVMTEAQLQQGIDVVREGLVAVRS